MLTVQRQWPILILFFLAYTTASTAQQCTLPSRIFLPTADEARFEQLGSAVDVDGGYMVAGIPENSSQQVYSGLAIVYKRDINNVWVKLAELRPSDPGKSRTFGNSVAIYGNSIIVSAREYNDQGISRDKLYIFEKASAAEWASSSESYVIARAFGTPLAWERFGKFDIRGDELVAIAYNGSQSFLEIYAKSSGVFSLIQSISTPPNSANFASYEWNLAVGTDIVVISTEQFEQPDHSNGGAFVYTKTAGLYSTSPNSLRAALQTSDRWEGFGVAIAISNTAVFVQGVHESAGVYTRSFYIFEKPAGGWINTSGPIMFESPGYAQSNVQLTANENYVFSAGQDFQNIVAFKKAGGGWSGSLHRLAVAL